MTLSLLLRHARLVTSQATFDASLGFRRGCLAWLGEPDAEPAAQRVLDLAGRTVLPGLIDAHTHFREPGAHAHKGTYASESQAAAAGGVTCVLTMPNTAPFCGTRAVLAATRECARRSVVDYGLLFGVAADNLEELRAVRGVPAFKLYLNETTGIASPLGDERLLRQVLTLGHPLVAHAEGDTLDQLLHLHRRWGTGPLHIAHVALAREVTALRRAKSAGQWVTAEATPHHLFLTDEDARRLGPLADMRPTLKSAADQSALWDGLADGTIDTIGTDHAPHLREEKLSPQPPPGVCGLQTMLPLLLTAVHDGLLAEDLLVRATSRLPAAIFQLAHKGEVRLGADADFVVVEPDARLTIRDEDQLGRPGWTPFAGRACRGRVWLTIRRGQVIYEEGRVTATGGGREVRCRDTGRWR